MNYNKDSEIVKTGMGVLIYLHSHIVSAEPILNKWTNIRDAFIKSVRHIAGRNRNKKYIFHNHLTFLIPEQTEESNWSINTDSHYSETEGGSEDTPSHLEQRTKKRKTNEEETKKVIMFKGDTSYTEIDEYHDPRVMNEDEAFFASLLPSIANYTEEERLEFRIGVLGLMKRIKHGAKWENDY